MKYWSWFWRVMVVCALAVGCDSGEEEEFDGVLELKLQRETVSAYDIAQFAEVVCNGDWQLALVYPEGTKEWCSLGKYEGRGNAKVAVNYGENKEEIRRDVTLELRAGGKKTAVKLTQKAMSESDPDEGRGWMELPEITKASNYRFIRHFTKVQGQQVRNFSMLFDTKERLAYWVAYPMCGMYTGKLDRTNAWNTDPQLKPSEQMNDIVSGYQRGHQIPSGDRRATWDMNAQTFYYSNMTPQLGNFNGKIWVDMENKVRDWAKKCDTLYVVTGAVLQTKGGNETVKHVKDYAGIELAVPNYYYKVLLSLTMSDGKRQYKAIGFWFEHKSNFGSVNASYARSVDEIERLTGWNFFKHLDAGTEQLVESELKPADWGLRN